MAGLTPVSPPHVLLLEAESFAIMAAAGDRPLPAEFGTEGAGAIDARGKARACPGGAEPGMMPP